jgi:opacity protein-like surface antigen
LTDHVSLAAEFGALPHEPVDKAGGVAPSVSPFVPSSGVHVNAYHTNANLFVQPSPLGRLVPYATAGFGTFTGSTVASTELSGSHFVQYSRETNPATNLGAGATYRLTNWLGLSGDYRHFIVSATDTEHVNRFTAGVSFFVRAPVVK